MKVKGIVKSLIHVRLYLGNSIETAILMSVKVRQEIYHRI